LDSLHTVKGLRGRAEKRVNHTQKKKGKEGEEDGGETLIRTKKKLGHMKRFSTVGQPTPRTDFYGRGNVYQYPNYRRGGKKITETNQERKTIKEKESKQGQ